MKRIFTREFSKRMADYEEFATGVNKSLEKILDLMTAFDDARYKLLSLIDDEVRKKHFHDCNAGYIDDCVTCKKSQRDIDIKSIDQYFDELDELLPAGDPTDWSMPDLSEELGL